MAVARLGGKIRRLRREKRLSQTQMAAELGLSSSYLNLLEHNQRPVTVPVLIKLAQRFEIDIESLNGDDETRLLSALMEMFADPLFEAHDVTMPELRELVSLSPNIGEAILSLYQSSRNRLAPSETALADEAQFLTGTSSGVPSEEVSDFLQQRGNHFPTLEAVAEALWSEHGLSTGPLFQDLVRVLATRYAVDVELRSAASMKSVLRDYRPLTRTLCLSELLPNSTRVFHLAQRIGLLGCAREIDLLVAGGKFSSDEATALARIALANYFAGAVMMPYPLMIEAVRETRYDVGALERRFGCSFEQVCHRLTTLRRPGAEGVAFHLIRVDIAGNISKRFSASGIPIARFGAACPRWNVYDAFATPGMLRVQVSEMPDGSRYFCVARTVTPAGHPTARNIFGQRVSRLSIGLGCLLGDAHQLAFADGLALDDPQIITEIGVNCRICDRLDCPDRAMPSLTRKLTVDENRRGLSAYAVPE
jgi:predicted transcriptional regulator/transcriptional regulator with XRE-family HTH domain